MRKIVLLILKAVLSAVLLYFALRTVNVGALASRLKSIAPAWVLLGLLALLVQTVLVALRWRLILEACGADLPAARIIRFTIISNFFNQTLPSSVGGDAVRIWLSGRATNWQAATYSVFLDRVVGVVVLALLVTLLLPWSLELVRHPIGRITLLATGLGCLAAGLIFVSLSWRRLEILQRWMPTRHLAAAAAITWRILRAPGVLAPIFILSVAIHVMTAVAAWCAARAVAADLSLFNALILVLPVILISVVPISIAGWGVRETAMVAAFAYAGLAQADGLIVSVLFGGGLLVLGILGGVVWLLTAERAARRIVPESSAPQ
jgi:hypothetical protein